MKLNSFDNLIYDVLNEAIKPFDPNDYNIIPANKNVSVLVGRFNPWTKGHSSLTDKASHPIVVGLVKGKKTALDKDRNPFPFGTQKEIIRRANNPKILDVVELPSGSIPNMISQLRDLGYEPKQLWTGADRAAGYKDQIKRYAPAINSDLKLKVLERNEEDAGVKGISATKVRNAIKNGDFQAVADMMTNADQKFVERLRDEMFSI